MTPPPGNRPPHHPVPGHAAPPSPDPSPRGGENGGRPHEDEPYRSYYGRPVLKQPVWDEPHMPLYLYLGGVSGASSALAAAAHVTARPRLGRTARLIAAASAAGGAVLLVAELGRPARFLNMLRVFKTTSPMSVGSWVLAAHGALTTVSAGSAVTGLLRPVGTAATLASAVTGPLMSTYTAALVADTAVPCWHEAHRELPFVFAGSAMASAGALAMLADPHGEASPARRLAAAGAVTETAAELLMEHRLGMLADPYRQGSAGRLIRAARLLTASGGLLCAGVELTGRRGRGASVLAALSLTAGALCTRFAVLRAGRASAADPKYTIVPQRARADAATVTPDRPRVP